MDPGKQALAAADVLVNPDAGHLVASFVPWWLIPLVFRLSRERQGIVVLTDTSLIVCRRPVSRHRSSMLRLQLGAVDILPLEDRPWSRLQVELKTEDGRLRLAFARRDADAIEAIRQARGL